MCQVAEKEREARRMHEEAVRVGRHADKLKRDRARSLQEIESKLRLLTSSNVMRLELLLQGNRLTSTAASTTYVSQL